MRRLFAWVVLALPILSTACNSLTEPGHRATPGATSDGRPLPDALPSESLACGAQITSDVRLDNDLTCSGNGLLVSGDDITIDLNGHTLTGSGSGNGITVSASNRVTISGGSVTRFQSGIFVNASTSVIIRDNEFSATNQAVLLQAATGNVIKHNTVMNNLARGFMLRPNLTGGLSTDNVVIDNVVIDTPTGIYMIRQPGNTIQNNTVTGAAVAGIDLAEGPGQVSGNIIRANHLVRGGAGIRFSSGWTDNAFVGNRIEGNACGTKGSPAGNTFHGNVFFDNATDACP